MNGHIMHDIMINNYVVIIIMHTGGSVKCNHAEEVSRTGAYFSGFVNGTANGADNIGKGVTKAMYRIAVVEDEKFYADQIQEYLERYKKEYGAEFVTTVFGDGEDITDGYDGKYDVIFMDIRMRFMDGMTAARKIRELDEKVVIIFVTNLIEYAPKGYEVGAMYYILKPINYYDFSQKLKRALQKVEKKDQVYAVIPTGEGVQKINISKIYYIESQSHNVLFKTAEGNISTRSSLKDLENTMGKYGFFRCGKGFMVNLRYVDGISGGNCIVREEKIPVSRSKKKEFMHELTNYVSEL